MSTAAAANPTEPTPTPAPASEVRPAPAPDEAHQRAAAALQRRREQRTPANKQAAFDAAALYGDDPERVVQAIADGTHPLQRELDAGPLERSKRLAAECIARDANTRSG